MKKVFSYEITENEMNKFAKSLASRTKYLKKSERIICLNGEMGSGKTTFCRYFSEFFNIEDNSPTYSIIEKRSNKDSNINIFHGDFHRISLERSEEIIEEYYNNEDIFLLEWTNENIKEKFLKNNIPYININFEHHNFKTRNISIEFCNNYSISVLEAKKILEEFKTPIHVINHIELVKKVAVFCAKSLQKNGIPIDINLVEASAILHDSVRYIDFPSFTDNDFKFYKETVTKEKVNFWHKIKNKYNNTSHGQAIKIILDERKKFTTAVVASNHMTGMIMRDLPFSWEEKCVYYADKRSLRDTLVSIESRLEDGRKRYSLKKSIPLENKILLMEKELKNYGKWKEEDLKNYIKTSK
jgi:tRNA threonylcarbamoyladenosine biosynthesis protein TsaE